MAFEVAFARDLRCGRCVGIDLPAHAGPDAVPAGLHPQEAAYARALPAARRITWMGGRLALRQALRDLGADPEQFPILSTPRGAPDLPAGARGSISHKPRLAVALAARTTDETLGVDLEIDRSPRRDIARRVLTAPEIQALDALGGPERARAVLVAFAAKEAIYKALDPWLARALSFQEVIVARNGGGGLGAELRLRPGEPAFDITLCEEPLDGHVLVAARACRR